MIVDINMKNKIKVFQKYKWINLRRSRKNQKKIKKTGLILEIQWIGLENLINL